MTYRDYVMTYCDCMMTQYYCAFMIITVFARSDAAATIYFITQFCVASIREKSQFYKNKELRCSDCLKEGGVAADAR